MFFDVHLRCIAELSVGEILIEAQSRWLRPLEVYDILNNYQQYHFHLNKEAPVLPKSELNAPSLSLGLSTPFDHVPCGFSFSLPADLSAVFLRNSNAWGS
jgi:hypothetical protein